jgi:hypothetical protein
MGEMPTHERYQFRIVLRGLSLMCTLAPYVPPLGVF